MTFPQDGYLLAPEDGDAWWSLDERMIVKVSARESATPSRSANSPARAASGQDGGECDRARSAGLVARGNRPMSDDGRC